MRMNKSTIWLLTFSLLDDYFSLVNQKCGVKLCDIHSAISRTFPSIRQIGCGYDRKQGDSLLNDSKEEFIERKTKITWFYYRLP